MFDGMVAVEFGKATNSGAVFNELPDRFADALMLVGAGYAIPEMGWAATLGWAAALLAILTAYIRALGASLGAGHDFSGIMAKQQRFVVLTLALVASACERLWNGDGEVLIAGLSIIIAGCILTIIQRTLGLIRRLDAI
jgi:phosphatidylglycerophosphate synthase